MCYNYLRRSGKFSRAKQAKGETMMSTFACYTLAVFCAVAASSFVGRRTNSDWAGAMFFALVTLIFIGVAITVAITNSK